ncbi:hypothetical protein N656DRAFT_781588 [Canariomyces notabilis]|uniref:Uncharacterized protein n=1 Tax=Canariomyces notabilis TaxID=2074819 RepID=A0AAN6QIF8_9PEZI|nr:hypothetical protein N656DRAFT_781588 [Canariomyces arenarius]
MPMVMGNIAAAYIEALSAETRNVGSPSPMPADEICCTLNLPYSQKQYQLSFSELLKKCPEYGLLHDGTGLTQFLPSKWDQLESVGKTFVIDMAKVDKIRNSTSEAKVTRLSLCSPLTWAHVTLAGLVDRIRSLTSVDKFPNSVSGVKVTRFSLLSALTWAHATRARLAAGEPAAADCNSIQPRFWNPHDWMGPRKGLFKDEPSKARYFGNSVVLPVTKPSTLKCEKDLVEACDWQSAIYQGRLPSKIIDIAQSIMQANRSVDEDFVLTRTALFAAMDDHRKLGVDLNPRLPHHFSANTWAFIGQGARFHFPGVNLAGNGGRPDAIRRIQNAWARPHALIMPTRPGIEDDEVELLVTLPVISMNRLVQDESWMSLVKRVVD